MSYGIIEPRVAEVVDRIVDQLPHDTTMIEVGIGGGETARGIKQRLESRGCKLIYYGVDVWRDFPASIPFAEATVLHGESWTMAKHVPLADLVFIDGCHCRAHVILDTVLYRPKVKPRGFLFYHDTARCFQGSQQPCLLESEVGAREAVILTEMVCHPLWNLFAEIDEPPYGCMVFQRR